MALVPLSEYLGISDAPQQPLFQRTAQLAPPAPTSVDTPWSRTSNIVDAVTALRKQKPLAQLQEIQNQYDTIRANADKMRQEQQIQQEVAQALGQLPNLNPEKEDYLAQRRAFQMQTPNAMLDPRVRNIVNENDQYYNALRQSREAARQQEQTRMQRMGELGVPLEEAKKRITDPYALGAAEKQYGANKPDNEVLSLHEKRYNALKDRADAMDKTGSAYDKEGNMTPAYADLVKKQDEAWNKYNEALEGRIAVKTPMAGGQRPQTGSFLDEMKGFVAKNPQAQTDTISRLKEVLRGDNKSPIASPEKVIEEQKAYIGHPEADENFYSNYINNPNVPIADKRKALTAFEKLAANPEPNPNLTLSQASQRMEKIKTALSDAKANLSVDEVFQREVNPAWTNAKNQIEKRVNEFARAMGVSPQNIYNSIATNEKVDLGRGFQDIEDAILGKDYDQPNPFVRQARNALEAAKAKNAPIKTMLGKILGEFSDVTNKGVLNALAREKVKPSPKSQEISMPRPATPEDAAKLPPGTKFMTPDGQIREVPVNR